jgi:demethylspheroidene O-methyltransferase
MFLGLRDHLLAQPAVQRRLARFWPTRRIARREARALFDICAGFVYAQVLGACVELDLFERLGKGPVAVNELAAACDVPAARFLVLVRAADTLRLLRLRGARVRLGALGAALRGNPGLAAMIAHHRLFYRDLADPVALLRGQTAPELAAFWPYRGDGAHADYSALMAATQPMIAAEILDAFDVRPFAHILDIGGGDGSFIRAAAARAPAARLTLFDLPEVAARARANLAVWGLDGRANAIGGDLFTAALPAAPLVTLVRVLHDHDDDRARAVLAAARAALAPGGTLLLAEPMAGAAGAAPVGDAYFGFYLLAMGSGRARRPEEFGAMLMEAGFLSWRSLATSQPLVTGVIMAKVS